MTGKAISFKYFEILQFKTQIKIKIRSNFGGFSLGMEILSQIPQLYHNS